MAKAWTMIACLASVSPLLSGCSILPEYEGYEEQLTEPRLELLLTNDEAATMELAVYYVTGRAPDPATMAYVAGELQAATQKAEVVVRAPVEIQSFRTVPGHVWNETEVWQITTAFPKGQRTGTIQLAYLFLDGEPAERHVSGFSDVWYMAMFPDTWRDSEDPAAVERTIVLHESGHALGLVDNGLPMQRDRVDRHEECVCHSTNRDSVMATPLIDDPTPSFGEDDLADIRAFQLSHA
jgi:hypothetical protein